MSTDLREGGVVQKEQILLACSKTWIAREFVMGVLESRAQMYLGWLWEVGHGSVGYLAGCHRLPILVTRGIRLAEWVGPLHQQPMGARFPEAKLSLTHR